VDLIISQMNDNNVNSMLRLDTDSIASVKHLQIFIHFTQNGLWQVLAIPDCPNAEDSAESAGERGFEYFTLWTFKKNGLRIMTNFYTFCSGCQ
jgi:hypothetical protein